MVRQLGLACVLVLWGAGCAARRGGQDESSAQPPPGGVLRLLTYNVAGLPAPVAKTDPEHSLPRIGPLLNRFDLVLLQEDFWYHDLLETGVELPHRSPPLKAKGLMKLGDGLRRFSRVAFVEHTRQAWQECHGTFSNGSDCLAAKGFDVGRHVLAPGIEIDVYNLHMEASHGRLDRAARRAQVLQLLDTIRTRSGKRAIIVAGDTNMRADDEANLRLLLEGAGLRDACRTLGRGEPGRIDRVMVRSSEAVELEPVSWFIDPGFVHDDGRPLSDHEPVVVDVRWKSRGRDDVRVAAR